MRVIQQACDPTCVPLGFHFFSYDDDVLSVTFPLIMNDFWYIPKGTVRVFRQKFTLDDAIGSHACSLEANIRVTNGIPLGSSFSYQVTL
jgi:hypothetical protein